MLCPISQSTKPKANVMPAAKASQNQRANRAPARIAMPTTIDATQPVRPRIGFGKPNTLPCHESRFLVHCTSGLKSHDAGPASGFARAWNFSVVSAKAAIQPMTPAITSHTARTVGRLSMVRGGMRRLSHRDSLAPPHVPGTAARGALSIAEAVVHTIPTRKCDNDGRRLRGRAARRVSPMTSGDERPAQDEPRRRAGETADRMSSR